MSILKGNVYMPDIINLVILQLKFPQVFRIIQTHTDKFLEEKDRIIILRKWINLDKNNPNRTLINEEKTEIEIYLDTNYKELQLTEENKKNAYGLIQNLFPNFEKNEIDKYSIQRNCCIGLYLVNPIDLVYLSEEEFSNLCKELLETIKKETLRLATINKLDSLIYRLSFLSTENLKKIDDLKKIIAWIFFIVCSKDMEGWFPDQQKLYLLLNRLSTLYNDEDRFKEYLKDLFLKKNIKINYLLDFINSIINYYILLYPSDISTIYCDYFIKLYKQILEDYYNNKKNNLDNIFFEYSNTYISFFKNTDDDRNAKELIKNILINRINEFLNFITWKYIDTTENPNKIKYTIRRIINFKIWGNYRNLKPWIENLNKQKKLQKNQHLIEFIDFIKKIEANDWEAIEYEKFKILEPSSLKNE